jgi:hypothetical protein
MKTIISLKIKHLELKFHAITCKYAARVKCLGYYKTFLVKILIRIISSTKYLGLPAIVGRAKIRTFAGIVGRVRAKLNGWKEKFLSQSGKEILLKAVIQAIPTYTMSVFQLPKALCRKINALMNKFFWGFKDNQQKMIWMSWDRMGRAKQKGGLGFRDLEFFNLAMLAKQGWRFLHNPDSLVAQIMKEKYYPQQGFLEASLGNRPSFAWRSIFNPGLFFWKV